jgi:GntR family transcriptional regulator
VFKVDKDSLLPIYYQIEEGLKSMIASNELQPGEMIPSERELCDRYDVSRMTVRQAINNLVNEGYLVRQRGKGTFVGMTKIEQGLKGLTSFTEDMKVRGMKPTSILLDFREIKVTPALSDKLAIHENEWVIEMQRIRLADDIPMAYESVYMPKGLVPELTKEIASKSLYDYIEKEKKLSIAHADQTLEAAVAKPKEADILEINEGAPVLLIERTTYQETGKPLEFVRSIYRGDRYKFKIELVRS